MAARPIVAERCTANSGRRVLFDNLGSPALVLCLCPNAEFFEKPRKFRGLVVGVQAAGIWQDPGVTAAEGGLLKADASVFISGNDAVGTDADEGDDGRAPTFDF